MSTGTLPSLVDENEVKPIARAAAKRVADPELIAMAEVAELVDALPEPAQSRVIAWLSDRYLGDRRYTAA